MYPYALSSGFPLAHHAPRLTHPGSPPTPANRSPPLTTRLGVAGRREPCAQALSRRGQGVTERGAVPTEFCLADRGAAQQAGDRGRVRRAVLTPVSPTPVSPYRTETQLPSPPVAQHVAGADSAADHNPPIRDRVHHDRACGQLGAPPPHARTPAPRSLATQRPVRRRARGALRCHGRSPLSFVRAAAQCRISMKIKQIDEMDGIIADKFSRFLMQRADNFVVLRRKPIAVRPPAARRLASAFRPPPPPPAPPALVPGIHNVPPALGAGPEPEPRLPRCHAGLRHLLPSDQLQPREHVQAQADRLRRTVHGRDRLGGPPSHPPSRPARACALPAPPQPLRTAGRPARRSRR